MVSLVRLVDRGCIVALVNFVGNFAVDCTIGSQSTARRGPAGVDRSGSGRGGNVIKLLVSLVIVIFAAPAGANQITGPASAVDSTVIEISGKRVMLFGIDSVMRKQICRIDGKVWQCWPAAVRALEILLDRGPATCETVGEPDVYGRLLARCDINDESLNEQLVRTGYAIARRSETTDYVAAETEAKQKRLGLWQGEFMMPDAFRRSAGIFVERP